MGEERRESSGSRDEREGLVIMRRGESTCVEEMEVGGGKEVEVVVMPGRELEGAEIPGHERRRGEWSGGDMRAEK